MSPRRMIEWEHPRHGKKTIHYTERGLQQVVTSAAFKLGAAKVRETEGDLMLQQQRWAEADANHRAGHKLLEDDLPF